jgi:SPP1 family predicted phage head-tail adaptor
MTTASDLTQRLTLQARATGVDALGQESTTWQDVATVWASVRPLAARDFAAADQAQASSSIRVHIRIGADVLATHRVLWGGRAWDIVGEPMPIDNTWLRFDAQSGVRDAK